MGSFFSKKELIKLPDDFFLNKEPDLEYAQSFDYYLYDFESGLMIQDYFNKCYKIRYDAFRRRQAT